MKTLHSIFFCLLSINFAVAEEKSPLLYPFKVTIGEETATVTKHDDLFAVFKKPVNPDAKLTLEKTSPLLIINAFPCQPDGTVDDTQAAYIIFAQNTAEVSLKDTKDRQMKPKKIAAGTYLANVVAHGKTSRIVFTIAEPGAKIKLPDFSKIMSYLRKKK